jgi:uncharacterized membrane protein YeaQ/YmgE (transglycosylase-associated protein family)
MGSTLEERRYKAMVWAVISWIILGALAGWIASMIMGTNEEQGGAGNIIVGIIGAVVGGLVVRLFGGEGVTGFNLGSLLTAILGAVILLALLRGFRTNRTY